jgi:hypothetical protein
MRISRDDMSLHVERGEQMGITDPSSAGGRSGCRNGGKGYATWSAAYCSQIQFDIRREKERINTPERGGT